mgnify:CR=1 FL=1
MDVFGLPLQLIIMSIATSAILCAIIIICFSQTALESAKRDDHFAVQSAHTTPTPRIGGFGILTAISVTYLYNFSIDIWSSSSLFLLSALPVFIVGLAEDLGFFASPRNRLLAATTSGVLFVILTHQWLNKTDIPGLDLAMQWAPFAIAFSVLLAVGVSHAFNLIDGLNGLSGITAAGASLALAIIAHQAGITEHRDFLLVICAGVVGFLIFNFPFGKIFLGDAGAYAIGHLLVWTSISILWNVPSITPFAILLIFFWPIADTFLAISRRLYSRKPIAEPDKLHFHQLVMRGVEIVFLGRKKRRLSNPLATLFTIPFVLAPMGAGILLVSNKGKAATGCFIFTVIFITTYKIGMRLALKLRRSGTREAY